MIDQPGQPLSTVDAIVPCHNYGHLLADAVKSVLADDRGWEFYAAHRFISLAVPAEPAVPAH